MNIVRIALLIGTRVQSAKLNEITFKMAKSLQSRRFLFAKNGIILTVLTVPSKKGENNGLLSTRPTVIHFYRVCFLVRTKRGPTQSLQNFYKF